MTPHVFSSKTPNEIVPLSFDFSAVLTLVSAVASLTISVVDGTDADVATMLDGAAEIQGPIVVQMVRGGVDGVTYELRCLAANGAERYELVGQLPVDAIT